MFLINFHLRAESKVEIFHIKWAAIKIEINTAECSAEIPQPQFRKNMAQDFHIYLQRSRDSNKQAQFASKNPLGDCKTVLLLVSVWHLKNWPKTLICCVFGCQTPLTPVINQLMSTQQNSNLFFYLYQHKISFWNKFWEVVTGALPLCWRPGGWSKTPLEMHVSVRLIL